MMVGAAGALGLGYALNDLIHRGHGPQDETRMDMAPRKKPETALEWQQEVVRLNAAVEKASDSVENWSERLQDAETDDAMFRAKGGLDKAELRLARAEELLDEAQVSLVEARASGITSPEEQRYARIKADVAELESRSIRTINPKHTQHLSLIHI